MAPTGQGPAGAALLLDTRVRVLAGLAKGLLNFRLTIGLVTLLWGAAQDIGPAGALGIVALMALTLVELLQWERVGAVLLVHPVALAADALAGLVLLLALGTAGPYNYAIVGGAAICGLCLGRTGAFVFTPLYVFGWYGVLMLAQAGVVTASTVFQQFVMLPGLLVAALFGGAAVRNLVLDAARSEQSLRKASQERAHAEERARLAREMHDSVAKSLHGIGLLADTLPAWFARDPQRGREQAEQLATSAREAGQEARAIIRAQRADDVGLAFGEALTQLARRWGRSCERPTEIAVAGDPSPGPGVRYEALAVVGESLANVDKHTAAHVGVQVDVSTEDAWIEVRVADHGAGFELPDELTGLSDAGHYGLVGMHERAARVGGSLRVRSSPGAGTAVVLRVPAHLETEDDRLVGSDA